MSATPTQKALAFVVISLCVLAAAARLGDLLTEKSASDLHDNPNEGFCVGVEHPDTGLGLVCAAGPDEILDSAVSKLNLPSDCKAVALPRELSHGRKVILKDRGGACSIAGLERLPAGMRLMIGSGIDVNRDDANALGLLPGIGEVKAERIIEERETNGPFKNIEDMTRVHGIGAATAERLGPWLEWE